jgi:hypothetical protein
MQETLYTVFPAVLDWHCVLTEAAVTISDQGSADLKTDFHYN